MVHYYLCMLRLLLDWMILDFGRAGGGFGGKFSVLAGRSHYDFGGGLQLQKKVMGYGGKPNRVESSRSNRRVPPMQSEQIAVLGHPATGIRFNDW